MSARTSSRVRTTGKRTGRLARTMPPSQGRSTASTSRSRNRSALSAWFCVEAATSASVASEVRNVVTSGAPMSAGWRLS